MELGGFPAFFSAVHAERPGPLFPPMPLRKFVFPGWRGRVEDSNLIDTAAELSRHDSPFNLDEAGLCRDVGATLPATASLAERHAKLQAATNRRLFSQLAPILHSDLFPVDLLEKKAGSKRGAEARRRREAIEAQVNACPWVVMQGATANARLPSRTPFVSSMVLALAGGRCTGNAWDGYRRSWGRRGRRRGCWGC